MPTTLGKPFSVDWRGRPPHMLFPDIPVWYAFLETYGKFFINLYYDCWVGGPTLTKEQERDPLQRMWRANTVKRIDALAELENEIWIIEVATYPGPRSLGQLMTYQALWLEDPKIMKPEKMCLVCGGIDTDIGPSAAKFGVQTFVMPPDSGGKWPEPHY
jgi:hypothetical protein